MRWGAAAVQVGRVLGRAGLRPRQEGLPGPPGAVQLGDACVVHGPRAQQSGPLLRGRLELSGQV